VALTGVAVDIGALRESKAFRRLSAGQLVSLVGRQITVVAVPYQVYTSTRSPVLVGLLGLAQVVPLVSTSLALGGLADRVDRRHLLLVTSLSFNIAMFQVALIAGPALGGLIIAHLGLAGAYLVDVASFVAALLAVWLLPPQPPHSTAREPMLSALRRGFAFVRRRPVIIGGYAMDLSAMIFGLPRAVFPVLAATTFNTNAQGLGYLYAAPGAGAVLAALSTGWLSRSTRMGRVVVGCIALWGTAIIAFGFVTALWVGLVLLAIAGAADSVSAICRTAIMQTLTPDELRGRITATYFMVVVGGPFLGDLEAGVIAGTTSARVSVVSGGVLCLVGLALSAVAYPQVWGYRGRATDAPPALSDDALAGPPV